MRHVVDGRHGIAIRIAASELSKRRRLDRIPMLLERRQHDYGLRQFLALTARSLHRGDSVRLQSYFHRPDEPVSTPARHLGRVKT
jgi:hypothetical protein